MLKNTITLAKLTEAKIFSSLHGNGLYDSLIECKSEGFRPLFIPEFIDLAMNAEEESELGERIWSSYLSYNWVTPSAKIFGKSKKGNKIVVYAHVPTLSSDLERLSNKSEIELYEIFAERITPQSEIERLLELEDNENVFVYDYLDEKQKSKFTLGEALEKTRLSSLVGGRNRAEKILKTLEKKEIETLEINDSDIYCSPKPQTREQYSNTRLIELKTPWIISSWNKLDYTWFLGVKDTYPALEKAVLDFDSVFKQVCEVSEDYVPTKSKEEFVYNLKRLFGVKE